MTLGNTSGGLFFSTPAQRIALARERYFSDGQRPSGFVSEAVIQSWTRCLGNGLEPQQRPAFEPVSRERARRTLDRNRPLLAAAEDECNRLDAMLAGTSCKALLTDARGLVLRATPAAGAGALLELSSRVGVYLGEPNFGSTAPGITASCGEACTVDGGEHFFEALHSMSCAAAPVRLYDGLHDGSLAGVLDLSVQGRPFDFDALSLVRLAATAIENRLFAEQAPAPWLLRLQWSAPLIDSPLVGLAALDESGRVLALNACARQLLKPPPGPLCGESLFGLDGAGLHRLVRHGEARPLRLPCGLLLWMQGHCRPGRVLPEPTALPVPADVGPAAAIPAAAAPRSLRQSSDELIISTLERCGGNVSHAARELGVSRGLLYRHLAARRAAGPK